MKNYFTTFVFFILVTSTSNAQSGWVSQTSPLGTQPLGQIQFVSSTEGWIVAENGKLLHTTNSGAIWAVVNPCGTDTVMFNAINIGGTTPLSFINATTGWVIGVLGDFSTPNGAVLYSTTNSGATWTKQLLTSWSRGYSVQFVDVNNGWVCVVNGTSPNFTWTVLHTTDAGGHWTSVNDAIGKFCIPSFVDANNGGAILDSASGDGYWILHTTNGGATWNVQVTDNTPGSFRAIQFVDINNGWVVGDSGKILRTTNAGTSWTGVTNAGISPSFQLRALFFINASIGWIGGQLSNASTDSIIHTTNGGTSWSKQSSFSLNYSIKHIYFLDANNGWLTTDYGEFAKTTSGGEPTSVQETDNSTVPSSFELKQNYPNPFNPSTTISFNIPSKSFVILKVYNLLGQEVATVVSEEMSAGYYSKQWNASMVSSGIYFYRLQAGSYNETRKLILLR